ncbi:S8 family serine peptidase [Shinella sp. BYT-45]|uniref:S8 family serine peptidase n=1 Tax=Shinella sp. BYT-45 TaxID=3377377 RepID=UPI00397E9451
MCFRLLHFQASMASVSILAWSICVGAALGQDASSAYISRGVDGMSTELREIIAQSFEPTYVTVEASGTTLGSLLSETCGTQPRAVRDTLAAEALKLNRLKSLDEILAKDETVSIPRCVKLERNIEVEVQEGDTIESLLRKHTGVYGTITLRKTFELNKGKNGSRSPEAFFRTLAVGQKITLPYVAEPQIFVPRTAGTDFRQLVQENSTSQVAAVAEQVTRPEARPRNEGDYVLVESVEIASADGETPCSESEDIFEPIDMAALKAVFDEETLLSGGAVEVASIGIIDTGLANPEDDFFSLDVLLVKQEEMDGEDGKDDLPKNGAIDDIFGVNLNNSPLSGDIQPFGPERLSWQYHGTRMASLLLGGPNVASQWGGKRPPIKLRIVNFASSEASGGMVSALKLPTAVDQLERDKVAIVNISLAGKQDHVGVKRYFAERQGMLFVVAAGNRQGGGPGQNLVFTKQYPARYGGFSAPNIITVAAHGLSGRKAPFSHYAHEYVDLAAPGCGVATRNGDGNIVADSGSSPATALVSFTAGLVRSLGLQQPKDIKIRILAAVDTDAQLEGQSWNSGRLNAVKAVSLRRDLVETADRKLHFGNIADRDVLWALCGDGAVDFSGEYEILKVVPNIRTPFGLKVEYFTESDGVLGTQECAQRDTAGRTLTIGGSEIPVAEMRDVVFRSL